MTPAEMAALHGKCFTTPRPWTEAEMAAALADPFGVALIRPEGFLLGRVVAGEAEILTLAVAPAARRGGVGRALVAGFLAEARSRGAESTHLEVAADNDAARALYAACGFVAAGRRRGYYRQPGENAVDAIVMVCADSIPS